MKNHGMNSFHRMISYLRGFRPHGAPPATWRLKFLDKFFQRERCEVEFTPAEAPGTWDALYHSRNHYGKGKK